MTEAAESRNAFARRLALIVAVSGFLIAALGAVALEILRVRSERSSQEALHAIAEQAGRRLGSYIAQQKLLLRALIRFRLAQQLTHRFFQLAASEPSELVADHPPVVEHVHRGPGMHLPRGGEAVAGSAGV